MWSSSQSARDLHAFEGQPACPTESKTDGEYKRSRPLILRGTTQRNHCCAPVWTCREAGRATRRSEGEPSFRNSRAPPAAGSRIRRSLLVPRRHGTLHPTVPELPRPTQLHVVLSCLAGSTGPDVSRPSGRVRQVQGRGVRPPEAARESGRSSSPTSSAADRALACHVLLRNPGDIQPRSIGSVAKCWHPHGTRSEDRSTAVSPSALPCLGPVHNPRQEQLVIRAKHANRLKPCDRRENRSQSVVYQVLGMCNCARFRFRNGANGVRGGVTMPFTTFCAAQG